MLPAPPAHSPLNGLTVTCRQCGGVDMTRLDRKEYRCRHCGSITVISDTDAERLEQLLKQVLAGQTIRPRAQANMRTVIAGAILFAAVLIATIVVSPRTHYRSAQSNYAKNYLAETSVPSDQVVLSPLEWHADSPRSGSYTGVVYNHSGFAILKPRYELNLFDSGIKSASPLTANGEGSTLEPGEYEPVIFRSDSGQPAGRYEVGQPAEIRRSTLDVAPVPLLQPTLVHTARSSLYTLTGLLRNSLKRPASGGGELMIYDRNGKIVASGGGALNKLMPGEQTLCRISAFSYTGGEIQVAAYEYLLGLSYENRTQSITLEEWKKAGTRTVPSRIVRVNTPNMRMLPAEQEWKPEDFIRTQP